MALCPMMPAAAFAKFYGLTGGELRVLLALAQGVGGKEAADMLGIGEAAIRAHLKRIFSKTGTTRQAELLQLLQGSAPPTIGSLMAIPRKSALGQKRTSDRA